MMKKKIILGLFIIFISVALFFGTPIATRTVLLPLDETITEIDLSEYTERLDLLFNADSLIPQRIGVQNISKRIKNKKFFYSLCGADNNIDIIYNSQFDRYYVKKDFTVNDISFTEIETLKISPILSPEIRKKHGLFSYEYDVAEELSPIKSSFIIGIVENQAPSDYNIPIEKISNISYVRAYSHNKQYFYNIGVVFDYDGNRFFSEGNINEQNECINCFLYDKD